MKAGTYHHTPESKEKIIASNKRRIVSTETRLKMSISGKGKHPNVGIQNPCWNGGRKIRQDGYILIRLYPGDQFYELAGKNGYILEHRLVMAKYLGRYLLPFPLEVVNHKNGIKDDNRPENLEVKSQSEHLQEHTFGYRSGYKQGLIDGHDAQIEELRKQIKLLQWQLQEQKVIL
jgi:hypothetical protein